MRYILAFAALLFVGCTTPSYPGIDSPSGGNSSIDQQIISYIDQRLIEEYYWLDEVEEKSPSFNRYVEWEDYLDGALRLLTTNTDDGYTKNNQRHFYSFIRQTNGSTRSAKSGFGIGLHYTIGLISRDKQQYAFYIDYVYPNSPAEEAGVKRGDVIMQIDDRNITQSNYIELFNRIENSTSNDIRLSLYARAENDYNDRDFVDVSLSRAQYEETTVIYNEIFNLNGGNQRVGYLVYTGFDSDYDDDLISTIEMFKDEQVNEVVLDLRCNGGGEVTSMVKLCSALLPAKYEDSVIAKIMRNPNNKKIRESSTFNLKNTGSLLNLSRLTVICSENSASASEMVVMGLRGIDFPVTVVGSTTQGKNCGMDVSRKTFGSVSVEYAPITFMCFNAKGFGDWGEGIVPDYDITSENPYGLIEETYPRPHSNWGDEVNDTALAVALATISGCAVTTTDATRATAQTFEATTTIPKPITGMLLYEEE